MSESGQLKESHNEKEKELLSLRDIHETHQRESSTQLRDLEAQLKSSEQRVSDLNESLKIAEEENKSMSTKISDTSGELQGVQIMLQELTKESKSQVQIKELQATVATLEFELQSVRAGE
ncbi:hypothetical protein YC2023_029239 [Brassica napus]